MSQVRRVAGSAALVLVDGVTPLRPEPALFESMLEGWGRQQRSRRLSGPLIESRERLVRRFQAFTMAWPWAWTPEQVETWSGSGGWAHSTIRSYQGALAVFLDYVCDTRYGWLAECEQRVGARPVQVCHEWNTAVHVADYEGRPERRPLTRVELQAFLDAADDRVESAAAVGAEGLAGGVPGCDLVQDGLRVGAAAAGGGHAGCRRFHGEPGGSGAGRVRGLPGAVRQGDAGQPAPAAGGGDGDAVGGAGAGGVPGRGAAAVWL